MTASIDVIVVVVVVVIIRFVVYASADAICDGIIVICGGGIPRFQWV